MPTPKESKIERLTREKAELAKKYNDLEQKLNAIYSRNQDPDLLTLYHQLEDRMAINLEALKEERAKNQELQKQLQSRSEMISEDKELEYRLDTLLEELKYERALNKRLQAELDKLKPPTPKTATAPSFKPTVPDIEKKPKPKKSEPGRPKKIDEAVIKQIMELRNNGDTVRGIASKLSLSVGSVSRIIKENS